MIQTLWIATRLPTLNEVIENSKGAGGSGAHYVKLKSEYTILVMALARSAKLVPMDSAHFHYLFIEKDKRRDKSNIFTAVKFIEDGLIAAKVLENDGWKQVLSITPDFKVGERHQDMGILVTMSDQYSEIEAIRTRLQNGGPTAVSPGRRARS